MKNCKKWGNQAAFKAILAVGCLTLLFVAGCKQKPLRAEVLAAEFIYEEAPFPSCHASSVLETKEGLLACWFGGTYESHPDVSIYLSTRGAEGWTEPRKVADGVVSADGRYPCWNPVLFRLAENKVALFYKVGPNPREWWGMYKISEDEGRTWGDAIPLPDGFLGPIKNKPQAINGNTILHPTSVEITPDDWKVYLEKSDFELNNWGKIEIDNNGFNAIQPTILFHRGGKMQILCRTQEGCLVEAWTTVSDGYQAWSPLQPISLPNNNSGIDGVTLAHGVQLLVYNPLKEGRNKLSLAASYNGEDWADLCVLEEQGKGEFSYPAIIQGRDGSVHITYTYNRERIKYVKIRMMR